MTAGVPGVLDPDDLRRVSDAFGVGEAQVRRDQIISHVLAAISAVDTTSLVFFGGTALARTHLPDLRLSEDIDLMALAPRPHVAETVERSIHRGLRRSFGRVSFTPSLAETHGADASVLDVSGVRIQIQLLSEVGRPRWPTEELDIVQRYSDAAPARLRVLTADAFAAAKLAAWADRRAPRDLYDMWGLADQSFIGPAAAGLFARFGQFSRPTDVSFSSLPTEQEWGAALGHQCRPQVSARQAAEVVVAAWNRATERSD